MSHVGERPDRPNVARRVGTAVWAMRSDDRRGIVIVVGILVAAVALLSSGMMIIACMFEVPRAAIALHQDTHLRAVSSVQSGTVVRIRETDHVGSGEYTEYVPYVRTEIGGQPETVLMREDSADEPGVYRVGQGVQVMIDPADPDEPRLRTEWLRADRVGSARYWTIVLVVSLAVFVPIMTAFVRWVRRNGPGDDREARPRSRGR